MHLAFGRMAISATVFLASISAVLIAGGGAASGAAARQADQVDWTAVQEALCRPGTKMPRYVFRINMPRTDLDVTVNGVRVQPGFALGSYAAFKALDEDAIVMGDLVLLDEEVNVVMQGLFDRGFEVTALHNHLNNIQPHVMYMHYERHGEPLRLGEELHQVLAPTGTPLSPAVPPPPPATASGPQLDTGMLDSILGHNGRQNGNLVQ